MFFLRCLFCDYEARIYLLFSCGFCLGDVDLDLDRFSLRVGLLEGATSRLGTAATSSGGTASWPCRTGNAGGLGSNGIGSSRPSRSSLASLKMSMSISESKENFYSPFIVEKNSLWNLPFSCCAIILGQERKLV